MCQRLVLFYSILFQPNHLRRAIIVGIAGLILSQDRAAADDKIHEATVRPFLAKHCLECHGPKGGKKRLRLDLLPADFTAKESLARWQEVLDKLQGDDMPPPDKPRPAQADTKAVVNWIQSAVLAADVAAQKRDGRVVLRRLNRIEYQNTIRDLLAVDVEVKDLLPEDDTSDGFDNIAETMHISPNLMEGYLQAADAALDAAIVHEPKRPALLQKRFSYKDGGGVGNANVLTRDDGVVFFSDLTSATNLKGFSAPRDGNYRVRISAQAYQSEKPIRMAVFGGNFVQRTGAKYLIGHFDIAADKPTVAEFVQRMKAAEALRIMPPQGGLIIHSVSNREGSEPGKGNFPSFAWHRQGWAHQRRSRDARRCFAMPPLPAGLLLFEFGSRLHPALRRVGSAIRFRCPNDHASVPAVAWDLLFPASGS
jgi:mono/diheme cytochrome c family protein